MIFIMIFYISFSILIENSVYSLHLSQKKMNFYEPTQLLFDLSSNRAFCFPTDEQMRFGLSDASHRNWGYSTSWNFSIAIQRVGQVLCKQLGYSFFDSIFPVKMNDSRNQLLWGASCLGYEQLITHCLYKEFNDPSFVCESFVGLSCYNCNTTAYNLKTSELLEITSPGYPNLYTDNMVCEWLIRAEVSSVFVKILYLSLPGRNSFGSCSKGMLEVRSKNKNSSSFLIHQTLCGEIKDKIFVYGDSILSIKLISGNFHPRPNGVGGFNLTVGVLDDLTIKETKKKRMDTSLSPAEVVGIVFGVLAFIIILYPITVLIKFIIIKRRRLRQHSMAMDFRTPCAAFSAKSPLPAIPRSRRIFSISSDGSNTYEDINQRHSGKSCSYLHLNDLEKNRSSENEENDNIPNYNFNIPTFVFTPYDVFTRSESESQPSDMPSFMSIGSDADSVFMDENYQQNQEVVIGRSIRNGTYTISPKQKGRHSTTPSYNSWKTRTNELLLELNDGGRRSSEPSVNNVQLPKTRSYLTP